MPREVILEVGKTYFSVFFADEKLSKPVVETFVYLGPDTIEDADGPVPGHLFQYASSFHHDGNWLEMTETERQALDGNSVMTFEAAHMDPIVDAHGLIQEMATWIARVE